MTYRNRITIEPGKRGGKPCVRGLRMTVSDVLDYLASGMSEPAHERPIGIDRGMVVPGSFFDPLPDELRKAFGADGEAS